MPSIQAHWDCLCRFRSLEEPIRDVSDDIGDPGCAQQLAVLGALVVVLFGRLDREQTAGRIGSAAIFTWGRS